MDLLLRHGLCNAAWAAALAFVAVLGSRLFRHRPALCHLLWLLVLLKLIVPSFFWLSVPDRDRSPRREQDLAKMTTSPEPLAAPRVKEDRSVSLPASGPARTLPDVMIQSSSRSWRWQTAVLAVWLAGAGFWWLLMVWNLACFRRLMRFAKVPGLQLTDRVRQLADRLELRALPAIWLLPARVPPMVWVPLAGAPRLILPEELWRRLENGQQDTILAHELAHLKRRDHWVRRLQALACGLYWWDPFAWWARRELERAEEQCCDAWVLRVLPHAASDYAESLVATAAFLAGLRSPLPPAASGVGRLIPLQRRLQMIMRDDTTGPVALALPRVLLIAGALCLLFLPAFASSPGQPRESQVAAAPVQGLSKEAPTLPRSSQSPVEQEPGKAEADEPRKSSPPGAGSERLPKVKVAHPIEREISDYTILAGHFEAGREIDLKPRVSGTVVSVSCRLGQAVKAGDVLCQIDPRSYQAELNKAQAEYDRAEAHQARWAIDLNAAKKQAADHVISQQEAHRVESGFQEAAASLRVAASARDLARLNLEFTRVTAPFAGTVTGDILTAGNVAVADKTSLASIIAVDQLCVAFNVPENVVLHVNRLRAEGKLRGGLPISVRLSDEQQFQRRSTVDFADFRLDPSTASARWRAVIPNPDGLLLPGLFVQVRLVTSVPYKALLVPQRTLVGHPGPMRVLVVTEQGNVESRPVTLGASFDELQVVKGSVGIDDWIAIDPVRASVSAKVVPERVQMPTGTSSGRPPLGAQ